MLAHDQVASADEACGDMLAPAGQMEMGGLVDDTLRRCPLGRASRRTGRTPSADLPGAQAAAIRPARPSGIALTGARRDRAHRGPGCAALQARERRALPSKLHV